MSAPRTRRGFRNIDPAAGNRPFWTALRWGLTRRPAGADPTRKLPAPYPVDPVPDAAVRSFLIGHATLLFEFGPNCRVLTDPVFSDRCSPFSSMGPCRFHPPGLPLEEIPRPTFVVISHNHYDHLDRPSIERLLALHGPDLPFAVPLGLGGWFRRRGAQNVQELDWWQSVEVGGGLSVTAVPAQHWSRRSLFDTNRTLWAGYVLRHAPSRRKVFFAGDTGYGSHFREIGQRLGPFDVAALPIGAYNPGYMMATVHQSPEEAVQAWTDLGGEGALLAMHHDLFRLTDEPPEEPAQRLLAEWERRRLPVRDLWLLDPGAWRVRS